MLTEPFITIHEFASSANFDEAISDESFLWQVFGLIIAICSSLFTGGSLVWSKGILLRLRFWLLPKRFIIVAVSLQNSEIDRRDSQLEYTSPPCR